MYVILCSLLFGEFQVLNKFLDTNRELNENESDTLHIMDQSEVSGIETAVNGLICIFRTKLHSLPSTPSIQAFRLLVIHINAHYGEAYVVDERTSVLRRNVIF